MHNNMKNHSPPRLQQAHVSGCPSSNGGLDYAVFEIDGMFGKRKIVIDNRVKPVRIQRSRKHKQVSPNGLPIVYVGRPTIFRNPFIKGEEPDMNLVYDKADKLYYSEGKEIMSNKEAVDLFEKMCVEKINSEYVKQELKGKNLSCWCKVGEPCHADILLKIANS